jgi:NADH-quinone oxidoreductase subunit F
MERPLTQNLKPDHEPLSRAEYEAGGGYQGLRAALQKTPSEVLEAVKASGLRGRGGAGFPTGQKWGFMARDAAHPRYLVVNADEMEPGTMKDRVLLEGDPHQVIEGALVSAYALEADVVYIFLRWAYRKAARALERALAEAYEAGYLGRGRLESLRRPDHAGSAWGLEMYLHLSPGRYMCGEETGLLNALEGKRATPRSKPPFPQAVGLWGQPTVVDNVETVACVAHIARNGPEWFRGLGLTPDGAGTKLYGASGRVKRPGVWELPLGTPLREIIEVHAGGMQEGYKLRAVLPGGASTMWLTEEHLDVPMDFAAPEKVGSRLGTGTVVVLDDRSCPVGANLSLQRFFARESCGWCTPCREGLRWVEKTLQALEDGQGEAVDLEVLEHHVATLLPGYTYCALAPGAMFPLGSALEVFREDFAGHVKEKRCPWGDRAG